jgi:ribose-phosphate pyrophosphokinase
MFLVNGYVVTPTVFPDGTSQIWHLSDDILKSTQRKVILNGGFYNTYQTIEASKVNIDWLFESEAEVFQLFQLIDLIQSIEKSEIHLSVPYFPYARQDKNVSNNSCFALKTLCDGLNNKISSLKTFDVHNFKALSSLIDTSRVTLKDEVPLGTINHIIEQEKIDIVIYPDKGAMDRYKTLLKIRNEQFAKQVESLHFSKVRDQSTGNILGIEPVDEVSTKGKNILVVDDICDGGRTFIEVAKKLNDFKSLHLYVSHGIFSKGVDIVLDSGYNSIYCWNNLRTKQFCFLSRISK